MPNNKHNKKSNNNNNKKVAKDVTKEQKDDGNNGLIIRTADDYDDDPNSGFTSYLRSNEGSEMMRLFVIANSLVVFITLAWPQMKETFLYLMEYFSDSESNF